MMKICVTCKNGKCEAEPYTHKAYGLPYEANANKLMDNEGYVDYVKKNGYHFNGKLSEVASKLMVNADGTEHHWSVAEVKSAMDSMGLGKMSYVTDGDMAYLANMYYADIMPDFTEEQCLQIAAKVANDPDGYDGLMFCRWTADVIGCGVDIDWPSVI